MPNRSPDSQIVIETAPRERREEALQLLQISAARARRLLATERNLDLHGLFVARRDTQFVGAAWGQVVPGRSAFCWPACLVSGEPEETAIALQSAVDAYCNALHVSVVQAVLPVRAITPTVRLVRAGYQHLADLDYLVATAERFPRTRPTSELEFQSVTPDATPRLARLVEQTYTGSLDCAALDGVRAIQDVLAGYRETGQHRPDWWLLARFADQDVGCVLLADHPEHDQAELMYLGVAPPWRGRGWGVEITRFAQWLIAHVPRQRLVLAVDNLNWPAQGVYSATGFDHWDRRRIYVRNVPANV